VGFAGFVVPSWSRVGLNQGLGDAHGLDVGQRFVDPVEPVLPRADEAPQHVRRVALEDAQRPREVAQVAAPAAADVEALAVDARS
jgi:hypothetical protein